jgi:hypothetical protein
MMVATDTRRKKIQNLTSMELVEFHIRMGKELGVKYVGDPGVIQRLWKMLMDRITRKFSGMVPEILYRLRPMCFKNIVYLPWLPGSKKISAWLQVLTAVHEGTHALRIRKYPGTTANWYGEYFTKDEFRALEEGSAQCAEDAVRYWATGEMDGLQLDDYYVGAAALELAQRDYDNHAQQLRKMGRGAAFHRSAAVAISILKSMGVGAV